MVPAALVGFLAGAIFKGRRSKSRSRAFPSSGAPAFLPDVPILAWERFIAVMAKFPKGYKSKRYKLGTFGMDARKLKDVGVMTSASKGIYGDEVGVWMGNFASPLTESLFLGSMPLQYVAFLRSCKAAAPKVSGHVGRVVDGKVASLSGLLGVCHAAGERGAESWLADEKVRKRFSGTTKIFEETNGIF